MHAAAARSVVLFGICANGSDFEIAAALCFGSQGCLHLSDSNSRSLPQRPAQLDSESSAALISTATERVRAKFHSALQKPRACQLASSKTLGIIRLPWKEP